MSSQSTKVSHETKSSKGKDTKAIERKWSRIKININKTITNIEEANDKPEENDIEDLIDMRNQLSEWEKSLDCFTSEIESFTPDLDVEECENWNDLLSSYFDKIKSSQEKLSLLIKQHRREQLKQTKELEIERENRNKELTAQNTQHQHELNLLLNKVKTLENSEESEQKTFLPSVSPHSMGNPLNGLPTGNNFKQQYTTPKKLEILLY